VQCGAGDASEHALRVLAGCAAAALDRRARDERERARAARRAAVAEAGLRILAADGADRVAEELAAAAALVLDAEHVFVRVLDAERRQMRLRVPREPRGVDEALAALDRRAAREALHRRSAIEAGEGEAAEALLVLPILLGGRALGTLGLYDRRAPAPPRFDATERVLAEQLAAFAGRALAAGQPAVAAPVPRDLAQRIDEELARAAESQASPAFALVLCRIENAAELGAVAAALALQRTTAALAQQLRAFDALAPLGPDGAAALLPAPGPAPAERIARLARAVAEAIAKEDDARVALAFGWALHPGDGDRASALLERAAETRIRML
jgi:GGDEF domain-containing protein